MGTNNGVKFVTGFNKNLRGSEQAGLVCFWNTEDSNLYLKLGHYYTSKSVVTGKKFTVTNIARWSVFSLIHYQSQFLNKGMILYITHPK